MSTMVDTRDGRVISGVGREHLRIHMTSDVGPVRLRRLLDHFGTLDRVRGASMAELQRVEQIGPRLAEALLRSRQDDRVEREIDRANELGVRIVCGEDADYPKSLRGIPDPPICLYVHGSLKPADAVAVAIVGTRRCSHYGVEQSRRFSELLARAGFTVVSGLARGIDGHAHRGALLGAGRTIAVLGNGLASIYPPEHRALADEIAQSGAVISEVAIDAPPDRGHFPARNRVIAGLSLGVIVVEAGANSGALITARLATDYNREVFAVPGRVDEPAMSAGTNRIIRDGEAKLITCLEDILDELGAVGTIMGTSTPIDAAVADRAPDPPIPALPDNERAVYRVVCEGHSDTDAICTATTIGIAGVASALTTLELKGLVRQLPGSRFVPRSKGGGSAQ